MKKRKDNYLKNLYGFTIFQSLHFFVPILMAFYKFNNLSFFQIMFMQSLYSLINVLFSVVAGAIADIKGEKFTLIISTGLNVCGYALGFMSHHLWQFIIFNILIALGNSFFAGIYRAFVYTTLLGENKEGEVDKVFSSLNRIALLSGVIIWPLCYFVTKGNNGLGRMKYMLLLTAISYLISLFPLFKSKVKAKTKHTEKLEISHYLMPIKGAIKLIKEDKKVRAILFDVVLFELATLTVLEFAQPLLKSAGLNLKYVGFFFSAAALIPFFILGKFSEFLDLFKKNSIFVFLSKVLTIVSFGLLFINNVAVAFVALCVVATFNKIRIPFFNVIINKSIDSKCRSTVFSVMTGIEMLVFAVLKPVMGILADHGIKLVLIFPILFLVAAILKRGEKLIF